MDRSKGAAHCGMCPAPSAMARPRRLPRAELLRRGVRRVRSGMRLRRPAAAVVAFVADTQPRPQPARQPRPTRRTRYVCASPSSPRPSSAGTPPPRVAKAAAPQAARRLPRASPTRG